MALVALSVGAPGATAARLEESHCIGLQSERDQLIATGARAQMEKGPAWARDNLPREALDRIARLIDIDEQLTFRCPLKFSVSPLKPARPDPDDDADRAADAAAANPAQDDQAGGADASTQRRPDRRRPGGAVPLPERRPESRSETPLPALRGAMDRQDQPAWLYDSRNR